MRVYFNERQGIICKMGMVKQATKIQKFSLGSHLFACSPVKE